MNKNIKIDTKKLYEVEVIKVDPTYRPQFNCQGLKVGFEIKDLEAQTSRTYTLPKTFRKPNIVTKFLTLLTPKDFSDDLLDSPNKLAKVIKEEILFKKLKAKLEMNDAETHINIDELFSLDIE